MICAAHLLCTLALSSPCSPCAGLQGGRVAVSYRGGELSFDQLDAYIARVKRHSSAGEAACRHIVELRFLDAEGRRRGVRVSAAELRAFLARTDADFRRRGLGGLENYLRREGLEKAEFQRLASRDLLLEKLVAMDLVRPRGDLRRPSPGEKRLWLEEHIARVAIEAPRAGEQTIAFRVEGKPVALVELGRVLRASLERDELVEHARDAVIERLVAERADQLGLRISAADLDAEEARRRELLRHNPRLGDLSWETWLAQQGQTPASFRKDPSIHTAILLRKLVIARFSSAQWRTQYLERRDFYDRQLGERRLYSWIFLRAAQHPNQLLRRSFAQAREQLEAARARIQAGQSFAALAGALSEHGASRAFGGRMAWVARASARTPRPMLQAIFSLRPGQLSKPIRIEGGMALVRLEKIAPTPDTAEMIRRLQAQRTGDERRQLLRDARIAVHF